MSWVVSALALVWLVPLVLVANGALVYPFSGAFRAWINRMLFGDSDAGSDAHSPAVRRAIPRIRNQDGRAISDARQGARGAHVSFVGAESEWVDADFTRPA